jgi:hypothetical protein
MIFLILALVWLAVLGPQYLRNRADARPTDSIRAFRRQLAVLGRTAPVTAVPALSLVPPSTRARSRATARKRRRDVLVGLLAAMAATLVLGLVPELRPLLVVHLVLDVLCAGYVALLVRRRRAAEDAALNVAYLPTTSATTVEPTVLLEGAGG